MVRVTVPAPVLAKIALSGAWLFQVAVPTFQLVSLVFQLPVPAALFQTMARRDSAGTGPLATAAPLETNVIEADEPERNGVPLLPQLVKGICSQITPLVTKIVAGALVLLTPPFVIARLPLAVKRRYSVLV